MLRNPFHFVYIVFSPILSFPLAFINVMAIYIFYRKFRLSSFPVIVMVNICICDIFVCLVSNNFYVWNILHQVNAWSTGAVACKLFKCLTMLANIAQIYFLCMLNADRLRRLTCITANQWRRREAVTLVLIGWVAATIICLPRLALFDEKEFSVAYNITVVACKPVSLNDKNYVIVTVVTFIVAYLIPACFIFYTLVKSQLYTRQRFKNSRLSVTSSVAKMNSKLALTFNLTGALFMIIWTPFFVISLFELTNAWKMNLNIDFTLRCTLLIFGSAKPVIYIICMEKFRKYFSFKCIRNIKETKEASSSQSTEGEMTEASSFESRTREVTGLKSTAIYTTEASSFKSTVRKTTEASRFESTAREMTAASSSESTVREMTKSSRFESTPREMTEVLSSESTPREMTEASSFESTSRDTTEASSFKSTTRETTLASNFESTARDTTEASNSEYTERKTDDISYSKIPNTGMSTVANNSLPENLHSHQHM